MTVISEAAAELELAKEELAVMVMASAAGLSKQEAEAEDDDEAEVAAAAAPPSTQDHHLCLPLEVLDEGKEEEEEEEAQGSPRPSDGAPGDSDHLGGSATAAPPGGEGMAADFMGTRITAVGHKARLLACAQTVRRLRAVLLLTAAVMALLVAGSYVCLTYRRQILAAAEYVQAHAPVSAAWYGLATAGWILLCLPSTVVELVAGAAFSWPVALLTLTVGKQLGCGLAFLLGRCLTSQALRDACLAPHSDHHEHDETAAARQRHGHRHRHRHRPSKTVRAMFLALEHHPWQITFLVRLLPIPISLKNIGMSMLPHCPFHVFMVTTLVAGLPFTACWVYLGSSCRSLLEALEQGGGTADGAAGEGAKGIKHRGAYFKQEVAMLTVGLVVAVALVVLLRRYTRRYTRLLAEREAAAAAAAAAASATDVEKGDGEAVRGGLERDVSTATTATSLTSLTLTPPSSRLSLVRATHDDEEDEMGEFELVGRFDDDSVYGQEEEELEEGRERQRGHMHRRRRQRRRRSSEGSTCSCSTLSHEVFGDAEFMCDVDGEEETV